MLSEDCPATSDVRGNLGPASMITKRIAADWLTDRWQAAKDMSGTSIPGEHWVMIDLQQLVKKIDRIYIDFETAYSKDYYLECSQGHKMTKMTIAGTTVQHKGSKHVVSIIV